MRPLSKVETRRSLLWLILTPTFLGGNIMDPLLTLYGRLPEDSKQKFSFYIFFAF